MSERAKPVLVLSMNIDGTYICSADGRRYHATRNGVTGEGDRIGDAIADLNRLLAERQQRDAS